MTKYVVFHSHEIDMPPPAGWYVGKFSGGRFVPEGAAGPYLTDKIAASAMPDDDDFNCQAETKPCQRWCGAIPCEGTQ